MYQCDYSYIVHSQQYSLPVSADISYPFLSNIARKLFMQS